MVLKVPGHISGVCCILANFMLSQSRAGPCDGSSMLTEIKRQTVRPGRFTPLERINQLFREHYLISFRPSTQNDLLIALPTTYYLAC